MRRKQTKRAKEQEKFWKEKGLKDPNFAKSFLKGKTAADKKKLKKAGWKF